MGIGMQSRLGIHACYRQAKYVGSVTRATGHLRRLLQLISKTED